MLCHFFSGQSMCSLANSNRFCTCLFFSNGTLRGLLAGRLTSQRRLRIVPVLTVNWRSSLILLEPIIGWVFASLAILLSIWGVVFLFLPRFSVFCSHFNALEIILAEQPITFCTSLYVFPSFINVLIKKRSSFEQCLERPIFLVFSGQMHSQHASCFAP